MNVKDIVSSVLDSVSPSKEEVAKLNSDLKEIISRIDEALRKEKVKAKVVVGGSVAKGSWLPGIHDIDLFVRFEYSKYHKDHLEISEILGFVLKLCFKNVKRLHGSRDYFGLKYNGYDIEIIPVIAIKKPQQALNLTDGSPLHVIWMKRQLAKKPGLADQARLAKQFFKGKGAYGAESYIAGFSGHVIEILTVHYGSFLSLVKGMAKWKKGVVIDKEKHYKSPKAVLASLNEEKLQSPLILVDPIEKERNAAAALGIDNFDVMVAGAKEFLKKPTLSAFEEKHLTLDDIKKKKTKTRHLIIYSAEPEKTKIDIAGAKILKQFEHIQRIFTENEFKIIEAGWQWDKKNPALLWLLLPTKPLSKTRTHTGPLTYGEQQHIVAFKNKYKRRKIWREGYHYYVKLPRDYTKVTHVVNFLKKDKTLKNFKIVYNK